MPAAPANPAYVALKSSLAAAREFYRAAAVPDDECVHRTRKALKTARAALRLLRPALPASAYSHANLACRDAGRYLSPVRDAHVLLATLDRVAAGDSAALRAIAQTRQLLTEEREQHRAELATPALRGRSLSLLELGCAAALDAAHAETGSSDLRRGLRRMYRRARRAYDEAQREGDGERLHEWRKQTKYLRSAAEILADAGVRGLRKTIKRADRIADLLGDEHDLAVLERTVRARGGDIDAPDLIGRLARRRRVLQARALRSGAKLFAQSPADFVAPARRFERWRGS